MPDRAQGSAVEQGTHNQLPCDANLRNSKSLETGASPLSVPVQRAGENVEKAPKMPPDLARVAAAWQHLPEAVRASIVAMVRAASPQ